jgi:pimeloyl-ACP methyl ester carboxylesterase
MNHSHEFIDVNGCKTELRRGGEGEPMLFLHGAGGNAGWLPFMEKLSEKFDLIAPSHPGFGESDTPDWLDNIEDVAYFYLGLLEKLDLKDVHVVGSSLGGWMACEIAVRDRARIKSLTLVSSAGVLVKGEPMGDIFIWSPEELIRNLYHAPAFAEAHLAMPVDDEAADIALKNRFSSARLAWSPRFHNPQLRKWFHRVTVPTQLIWGDDDKIFPLAYAHEFKTLLPHAELQVFSGCGHLPHIEKQDDFVNAVTGFAQGVNG